LIDRNSIVKHEEIFSERNVKILRLKIPYCYQEIVKRFHSVMTSITMLTQVKIRLNFVRINLDFGLDF